MRRIRVTRAMATGAALVAAIAGGASAAALATSQSSSKSFRACLTNQQKTLYNVQFNPATPPVCHKRDKRVSWNQTGPTGQPGQPGQAGTPGKPGADGKTILSGSGAPATTLGTVGDFYIDTTANAIYGPKNASGWGGPLRLMGPKGDPGQPGTPGADGKTVLDGSGAPAAGLGTNGDFYIDTAANAIYGPKTNSGWGSPTSLVGAKGDQGSPGMSGFTTVTSTTGTVPAGNLGAIDVPCANGQTAISGGYTIPFTATVLEDHPVSGNPSAWHVAAAFPSSSGTITA